MENAVQVQGHGPGTGSGDGQTTVVETTRAVETTPAGAQPAGADLGKVRELVLKAHPDVVPDLIRGGSVDELIASVTPARTAYQRIADQVRESRGREGEQIVVAGSRRVAQEDSSTSPVVQPPVVPAGGATNVADPGELKPMTKIAQALAERKRK